MKKLFNIIFLSFLYSFCVTAMEKPSNLLEPQEEFTAAINQVYMPYACKICFERFDHNVNLKTHINSMHIQKFSRQADSWVNPIVIPKPKNTSNAISCKFCSYKCARDNQLLTHMKKYHAVKKKFFIDSGLPIFKCPICPETFQTKNKKTRHFNKVHATNDLTQDIYSTVNQVQVDEKQFQSISKDFSAEIEEWIDEWDEYISTKKQKIN